MKNLKFNVIVLLLFLMSCNKENVLPDNDVRVSKLNGTWNVYNVKNEGGADQYDGSVIIWVMTLTPDDEYVVDSDGDIEKGTYFVDSDGDSDSGTYKYEDKVLTIGKTYKISFDNKDKFYMEKNSYSILVAKRK